MAAPIKGKFGGLAASRVVSTGVGDKNLPWRVVTGLWRVLLCSRCLSQQRKFSTNPSLLAGGKWRERHGLARNPTQDYGPLVDQPDWSYEDGRPAPPTQRQILNQRIRRETAEKIDLYAREMLEAKQRHTLKQQEFKEKEEKVRKSRLQPKGVAWNTKV